jgi:hypothetical protein
MVAKLVDLIICLLQLASKVGVTEIVRLQDLRSEFLQLKGCSTKLVPQGIKPLRLDKVVENAYITELGVLYHERP